MLVHGRSSLSIKFAGTHLYTWVERVERGTVRVKCLAQEHNTTSPTKARTRTSRSGGERANHKSFAPSLLFDLKFKWKTVLRRKNISFSYPLFRECAIEFYLKMSNKALSVPCFLVSQQLRKFELRSVPAFKEERESKLTYRWNLVDIFVNSIQLK